MDSGENPWFREPISKCLPRGIYYRQILSHKRPKNLSQMRPKFSKWQVNAFLDISTKKAALKASSSVVALLSYTGGQELTQCSGLIIEDDGNNGHIVLTSSKLIRHPTKENVMDTVEKDEDEYEYEYGGQIIDVLSNHLADDLKVTIYLYDGQSYEGKVLLYDFHFNLAWIQFYSDSSIPSATLRKLDDRMDLNLAEEKSLLRPHSSNFTLVPGDPIIAVGRYFAAPFDLMAAPGVFNIARCNDFDCTELFMGACLITSCGEGGPLINLAGEVIGVIFYESGYTPFLPINIAQKCWEYYKRYGRLWRPSLGVVATNLYTTDISLIEKVTQKIPSICNGVLVEQVIQGSSLDSAAGLHENDVIVKCGEKTVHSFLEFLEMVWDMKVGDRLQLSVVRICENDPICVNMVVGEVTPKNFYRWPRNGYVCAE